MIFWYVFWTAGCLTTIKCRPFHANDICHSIHLKPKTSQWKKFTKPLRGVTVPWAMDVVWIVSGSLLIWSLNYLIWISCKIRAYRHQIRMQCIDISYKFHTYSVRIWHNIAPNSYQILQIFYVCFHKVPVMRNFRMTRLCGVGLNLIYGYRTIQLQIGNQRNCMKERLLLIPIHNIYCLLTAFSLFTHTSACNFFQTSIKT